MQSSLPRTTTLLSSASSAARTRTRSPITSWSRSFSENRDSSQDLDSTPATASASSSSLGANKEKKKFQLWMEGDGSRFRRPIKGRTNWLGDTPFPLNPSFNPLPPLSDAVKTKIYNAYTSNILSGGGGGGGGGTDSVVVRAVSMKFGVGQDRVRAVIRLKEVEKRWRDEGLTLQTDLLESMESYLGVKQPVSHSAEWRGKEDVSGDSKGKGKASKRTVFEMVDKEGSDHPVLPLLSHLHSRRSSLSQTSTPTTTTASSSKESKGTERQYPASRAGRAGLLVRDLEGTGTEEGRRLEESREREEKRR